MSTYVVCTGRHEPGGGGGNSDPLQTEVDYLKAQLAEQTAAREDFEKRYILAEQREAKYKHAYDILLQSVLGLTGSGEFGV